MDLRGGRAKHYNTGRIEIQVPVKLDQPLSRFDSDKAWKVVHDALMKDRTRIATLRIERDTDRPHHAVIRFSTNLHAAPTSESGNAADREEHAQQYLKEKGIPIGVWGAPEPVRTPAFTIDDIKNPKWTPN